jgi:predicted RNA-binding protein (virulence factor B family)
MIELGNTNTLTILRRTSVGLFLGDQDVDDLLLPTKYVPDTWNIGDSIEVFCYLDHEERPVATTIQPFVKRNQFGFLRVAEVNEYGAFMDWGLEKHLLAPYKQQRDRMEEGKWYVVYCYLDEKSFRLVASSKLDAFLSNENLTVRPGEAVDLLISRKSDLGWDVVVNGSHKGLVFFSDVFKKVSIGDRLNGYIRNIRPDSKLDVVLEPIGHKGRLTTAERIYSLLLEGNGYLPLHDKSDPADIQQALQISKKNFKKAIGTLYRERKIEIKEDGIYKTGTATK